MITHIVNNNTLKLYDSIDDLPIRRYHKFNKLMLIDAGVGSDVQSINQHIDTLKKLVFKDRKDEALTLLDNIRQSFYLIAEEISPRHLAFAVLIKSINGEEVHDISDENLKRILAKLAQEKVSVIDSILNAVKKKLETELGLYFKNLFDDPKTKELYQSMKQQALHRLDSILRGVDHTEEIDRIDDYMLSLFKPMTFSGSKSIEIDVDRKFEELCVFLKSRSGLDCDTCTVLQFYNTLEYIKKNASDGKRRPNKVQ